MTTPSEPQGGERSRINHAPSKRSMERARGVYFGDGTRNTNDGFIEDLLPKYQVQRIALAFDRLIDEACQVVRHWGVSKGGYGLLEEAIRLKLKGSPEDDTNRDSSKTASKGGRRMKAFLKMAPLSTFMDIKEVKPNIHIPLIERLTFAKLPEEDPEFINDTTGKRLVFEFWKMINFDGEPVAFYLFKEIK